MFAKTKHAKIAEEIRQGASAKDLAEKYFYSISMIHRIARAHGIRKGSGPQPDMKRDAKIRALVKNGLSYTDIAVLVGMSRGSSVRKAVERMRKAGYKFKEGDSHDEYRCL